MIFLDISFEKTMERIAKRGRDFEQDEALQKLLLYVMERLSWLGRELLWQVWRLYYRYG